MEILIKTLIELGADIDGISGFRVMDTPLIAAAWFGNTGVVAYLLRIGAEMDVVVARNMTALDYAVKNKYEDVEEILLYRETLGC
jgi:ankyrin repeat protein